MKEIPLTRGYVALIDDEDYERVVALKWSANVMRRGRVYATHYFRANDKKVRSISLQRFILNANPGQIVDHINGNCLLNTRANLRVCSNAENLWNQRPRKRAVANELEGLKGVSRSGDRYRASITVNGKKLNLGTFKNPALAAAAYNEAAIRYHGSFARPNPLPHQHQEAAA